MLHKYLRKCFYKTTILEKKYKDWLFGEIHFCCKSRSSVLNTIRGRPKKIFEESSSRSKMRKIRKIISDYSTEEITYAAQVSLNKEGKRRDAFLIKRIASASPEKAKCIKKLFTSSLIKPTGYTAEEALALMIKLDLTKEKYQIMRNSAKSKSYNIYPSYNKVREVKVLCYPPKENIHITDMSAEIKLQGLLDHTTHRIIQLQEEVIHAYMEDVEGDPNVLTFIYKWGIDGSSNQSIYKQSWLGENNAEYNDESVIILSLVPIRLFANSNIKNDIILWQNPRPGSTRFCRPIKFTFEKETAKKTRYEVELIEKQINELNSTTIYIKNRVIQVKHIMLLTMVDGKVCNSITETSSQVCYICGATPKTMNNIQNEKLAVENYKFGLSTLHAWIRFFECLLHISYRLHAKKWQIRTKQDKEIFESRKKEIQTEFKNKMALTVDQPKIVSGNSNDGNTARRFFNNPELASSITGIDINIIQRFSVILRTISSGFDIDLVKFEKYCIETANLYKKLYSWFYMPVTVHKILYHGSEIIKSFLIPIGQLSEEAMEARNKHFRQYREHRTRKISRTIANEDLLHALLMSSDPFITSQMVEKFHKNNNILPLDVRNLLTTFTKNVNTVSDNECDSESNKCNSESDTSDSENNEHT